MSMMVWELYCKDNESCVEILLTMLVFMTMEER
jgi:hypothetical protein